MESDEDIDQNAILAENMASRAANAEKLQTIAENCANSFNSRLKIAKNYNILHEDITELKRLLVQQNENYFKIIHELINDVKSVKDLINTQQKTIKLIKNAIIVILVYY